MQQSGLQPRSGLALGGRLCAAEIRLGHGSRSSESVHRGLWELVSRGGWAARAPPPGSPGSGRARAACPVLQHGHQGTAGRQRSGPAIACPGWALHGRRPRRETSAQGARPSWPGWQRAPRPRAPVCALVTVRLRPPARHARALGKTTQGRSPFSPVDHPGRNLQRFLLQFLGLGNRGTES